MHAEPVHVVPAKWQQVEDDSRGRGAWDEVLQQVLQVTLKEHALPAAAVLGHMAHRPALRAAAAPVVLTVDQVGCHSQRQVRGQVVQDLLLVLWEQLLQDRVVFVKRGGKAGVNSAGNATHGTLGWACLGAPRKEKVLPVLRKPESERGDKLYSQEGSL